MNEAKLAKYTEIIDSTDTLAWREFLKTWFPHDANRAYFTALADFVCGLRSELPESLKPASEDACFAALLARANLPAMRHPVIQLGPDLDFLQNTCVPDTLSALQLASLAIQCRRVPKRRVAIILMARDEGIYLPEWLSHHRLIGAEHIFVYTNDNADGSDRLLHELAAAGSISLIVNSFAPGVNPQRKAYQHAILLLEELRDYRWALFIDADEFMNFRTDEAGALPDFIDGIERRFAGALPGAVVFPWHWRFTDRALNRQEINVLGHYPHAAPHRLFKPLVNLRHTLAMCQVHIPTQSEHGFFVDGQMRRITGADVWKGVPSPYTGPVVEHFWSKSFVEFLVKKRRGDHLALEDKDFLRDFSLFFAWTGIQSDANRVPISPAWIEKVEAGAQQILSSPAIAQAYAEVVDRHRAYASDAANDAAVGKMYRDLLASTRPILG